MARHGYRVANNEINLRCDGDGRLTERCLNFIEYTLVRKATLSPACSEA